MLASAASHVGLLATADHSRLIGRTGLMRCAAPEGWGCGRPQRARHMSFMVKGAYALCNVLLRRTAGWRERLESSSNRYATGRAKRPSGPKRAGARPSGV
ncbi:hypothetical protein SVAN01_04564 [Stagonosporopsis vannaccii]|nr:hypothetical protein SVAN01_04564 [Stagonosporopsis vannaccii]